MIRARLITTAVFLLLAGFGSAQADCTSPVYPAGSYQYATASNTWKFCNGTDWNDFICATSASGPVTIFLTSGTSWTVPADWNSSDNTIEAIGGGGGGGTSTPSGGGGGGEYRKITNFSATPGASIPYAIGAGGTGGGNGGDTIFNTTTLIAKGGKRSSGSTGGAGGMGGTGAAANFNGGKGGNVNAAGGGGGGGGAAGPNGTGANGGTTANHSGTQGGGGGGGADGGTAGAANGAGGGGAGGNGYGGAGGGNGGCCNGSAGAPGSLGGGGGGGGQAAAGGDGGAGAEWTTYGAGGGGGGDGNDNPPAHGGDGALYGGGGGGTHAGTPGSGAQGIIVITYTSTAPSCANLGTCVPGNLPSALTYEPSENAFKYCNGSDWIKLDGGTASSDACANQAATALYIADYGNARVRRVDMATGVIATVAGTGTGGYSGDGGAATGAKISANVEGVAVDGAGNLYIADSDNYRVRKVDHATGIITTIVGTGTDANTGDGGQATSAAIAHPARIAFDSAGNIYISTDHAPTVRKIDKATGIISTVAGNGTNGYSGDGGAATSANIEVIGVSVDSVGNIYMADNDAVNGASVVRKVTASTGKISTIAGTNSATGYTGDGGPASAAKLNAPVGAFVGNGDDLYFTDANNTAIRKIAASTGIITTVAGGSFGTGGDGGPGHQRADETALRHRAG